MMIRQRFEAEYKPLFAERGYGSTIWSPLMVGFLCGKYNDGVIPEGRVKELMESEVFRKVFAKFTNMVSEDGVAETKRLLQGLADIAKELGYSQT